MGKLCPHLIKVNDTYKKRKTTALLWIAKENLALNWHSKDIRTDSAVLWLQGIFTDVKCNKYVHTLRLHTIIFLP